MSFEKSLFCYQEKKKKARKETSRKCMSESARKSGKREIGNRKIGNRPCEMEFIRLCLEKFRSNKG